MKWDANLIWFELFHRHILVFSALPSILTSGIPSIRTG